MKVCMNFFHGYFIILLTCIKDSLQGYHERRLLNGFFGLGSLYSIMERPVANESLSLPVQFGITLQQIMDVDEKNQLLTSSVWMNLEWYDHNLRWNSSDYGGLTDIRVDPDKIWKPDVLLYNSADDRFDNTYHSNVVVYNTGKCVYIPPGIFKSTCKINITWFPFDEQHCPLKFGSWSYDGDRIDLQLKTPEADLHGFMSSGEWELIGVPAQRRVQQYPCCPEPYIDVTYTIIIRRRVLFYVFNLVLPCCLISSITLLGFCLPVESGEKLTLGVTILLSLTVFLLLVAESMPATSDAIPLIGTYFTLIMVMTGLSVVLTVIVLNIHFRGPQTHIMYPWIRKILLVWLPWILRVDRPQSLLKSERDLSCTSCCPTRGKIHVEKYGSIHSHCNGLNLETRSSSLLANVMEIDDRARIPLMRSNSASMQNLSVHQEPYHRPSSKRSEDMREILNEIRFITNRQRFEDYDKTVENDWKFAAIVLDRLFLWVIVAFTIGFTGGVLMKAPYFQV